MDHTITQPDYVRINKGMAILNGSLIADIKGSDAAEMYRVLGCNYPKFFKMDSLCKWAWLGAELLLREGKDGWRHDGLDKSKIAIVVTTSDGCLEVDKRYAETLRNVPSPALFVYTLPNIMLGEICIRHGFTGEQMCRVQDDFDAEELLFQVTDLLMHRGVTHCLFGKVDAVNTHHDVCLFWADAQSIRFIMPEHLRVAYEVQA